MTAWDEVRSGDLGEEFVELLYRQVAVVAKVRNFPPPPDHRSWNVDAVQETAHGFLLSTNATRRLAELAATAEDSEGFERLFEATVRNFLREQGRKTTLGKLVRRLRSLLGADPRFMVVPAGRPGAGSVALASAPSTEIFGGRAADLVVAARAVADVSVVRWSPSAKREGPVADSKSLLDLSEAVLAAADGSLRVAELADVIATRLGLDTRGVPATLAVEDIDHADGREEEAVGISGRGGATEFEVDELAQAVLSALSVRERLVLAWLHETVRTIADRTGLAVSTAGAVKQRVTDKMRVTLSGLDEASAEAVALSARDAARLEAGLDPV